MRKPLLAVSASNDAGNMCIFDSAGSCILSGSAPELLEIRRLVKQATKKLDVQREGGTFTLRTWRLPESLAPPAGFQRPGR